MGCDIHICTEVKETVKGKEKWINVDNWRVNKSADEYEDEKTYILNPIYKDRNYELFSFLANVRNYYGVKSFGFKRGAPKDASKETKEEIKSWDFDGHSHGFCTLKELKDAVREAKVNCFEKLIEAIEERKRETFWIIAKERDDLSHDGDIRIVFWFDN